MTAVVISSGRVATVGWRPARAVAVLGWHEARRMVTSPAYLAIVVGMLAAGIEEPARINARIVAIHALDGMLVYGALASLFAAGLVASSAQRAGVESQLAPTPMDAQLRTLATGLGVVLGPFAVGTTLTLAMAYLEHGLSPAPASSYHGWEYAAIALTWLGTGLLGLAVARWLPWPGVPLLVFAGLIAWTLWAANLLHNGRAAGHLMPFVISREELGFGTTSVEGHLGWHAGYLLGLCLLAFAAALWRYAPMRARAVASFGLVASVVTASAGWLQLP